MDVEDEHEEAGRTRTWIGRLRAQAESLDGLEGSTPAEFCEAAMDEWQRVAVSESLPPTSPAMLLIFNATAAMTRVMLMAVLDSVDTPDYRDRLTRDSTQRLMKDALESVLSDSEGWLSGELPTAEEVKQGIADANKSGVEAVAALAKRDAELEQEEQEAASDPYGAILGFYDPNRDVDINFEKLCSFTQAEHELYCNAYERLRKMLDSELLQHISDQSDAVCDVLISIFRDLAGDRVSLTNEDAWDERRRKLRSALISFTSALHSHKDQSIRAVRDTFGRKTPEEQAVLDLFNDMLTSSFEYRWLVEMRDALLHGDINAFKYEFTARLHGEPSANVYMDRGYMLRFSKEQRKKPWLTPKELDAWTSDPSVLDMIKAIQPLMGPLQEKLDAILYPNAIEDARTIRELIGQFRGRKGLYALQNGPGFTRRTRMPPLHRLAPRVLAYAESLDSTESAL
ncbi:hypothetical protein [Mycobacteroides abscessus]